MKMKKIKSAGMALVLSMTLLACQQTNPVTTPGQEVQGAFSDKIYITGKVEFPEDLTEVTKLGYVTKATQTDIAPSATVSLIDPETNVTIGTTLTNSNGIFLLSNAALTTANPSFSPVLGKVYILEAMKRIGGAGNDAMTLRTNIKYNGSSSWSSITQGSIFLNTKTTAISVISNLTPSVLSASATIGSLPVINGSSNPQDINTQITAGVINQVNGLVEHILQYNKDPVAYIKLSGGQYSLVNPETVPTPDDGGIPGCVGENCSTSTQGSSYFYAAPYITTAGSGGTWGSILEMSASINASTLTFNVRKLYDPNRIKTNNFCPDNSYFEEANTQVTLREGSTTGPAVTATSSVFGTSQTTPGSNPANATGCTASNQNNKVVFNVNLQSLTGSFPKSFYVTTSNSKGTAWFGPITIVKVEHADDRIVFHSDVDGNYDIYTMNVDGTDRVNITNNISIDNRNPRYSHDKSKIIFTQIASDGNIYIMNKDGSGQTSLTSSSKYEYAPVMSRDGSKIAYNYFYSSTDRDIYIMNSDGTEQRAIIDTLSDERDPSFSPEGNRIVYSSTATSSSTQYLYKANVDGSNIQQLTTGGCADWSPNSEKIVFSQKPSGATYADIFVINSDGTGLQQLTNMSANSSQDCPTWSRDGSRIMFSSGTSAVSGGFSGNILIMNADGTNLQRLTATEHDREPAMRVIENNVNSDLEDDTSKKTK